MTWATRVLAPNPGPMTLKGTNSWILAAPAAGDCLVVDPGPLDERHLTAVAETAFQAGRAVSAILLTHGHPDHAEGAARFAELVAAPVRAADPGHCLDGLPLTDGEVVRAGPLAVEVVATPGHTADSVCLLVAAEAALLTGDTVLGRGTTVVAHPDGRLGDYLASLARLRALAADLPLRRLLPGHGPDVTDPLGVLDGYLAHRSERLDQVRAALAAGARTASEVVDTVYADVDPGVRAAAEQSVRAQLDHLGGVGARGNRSSSPP